MVSPLHEPHFSPTVNKIGNTVWNFTIFHHTNQTETWLYLIIIFPNNSKNSQTWVLLVVADECGCSKTREKQFLCTHKTHDCNMKQRDYSDCQTDRFSSSYTTNWNWRWGLWTGLLKKTQTKTCFLHFALLLLENQKNKHLFYFLIKLEAWIKIHICCLFLWLYCSFKLYLSKYHR